MKKSSQAKVAASFVGPTPSALNCSGSDQKVEVQFFFPQAVFQQDPIRIC
jgi:hypothetical protein